MGRIKAVNITSTPSRIRSIKSTDPEFMMQDGFTIAPRAAFEVDNLCPWEYKSIIATCINNGWLKPVAYVKDHEMFWMELER